MKRTAKPDRTPAVRLKYLFLLCLGESHCSLCFSFIFLPEVQHRLLNCDSHYVPYVPTFHSRPHCVRPDQMSLNAKAGYTPCHFFVRMYDDPSKILAFNQAVGVTCRNVGFVISLFKSGVLTFTSTLKYNKNLLLSLHTIHFRPSGMHVLSATNSMGNCHMGNIRSAHSNSSPDSVVSITHSASNQDWKRCCQLGSLWYGATSMEKTVQSSGVTGRTKVSFPQYCTQLRGAFVCLTLNQTILYFSIHIHLMGVLHLDFKMVLFTALFQGIAMPKTIYFEFLVCL